MSERLSGKRPILSTTAGAPGAVAVGIDIGSTTVKAVVVDTASGAIRWRDYQRHHARQPAVVLDFLERIAQSLPGVPAEHLRVFITGSGAQPLTSVLGAPFVQEVNALTLAVERLYPEANAVVELGGQDAKMIVFKEGLAGQRRAWSSMNDRCAAGTGATIDKCLIKVGVSEAVLSSLRLGDRHLHYVAAKCGVFAEMDVVNLVKSGVPAEDILCSLADAIVQQNLSVLARGHTLRPRVLLLGGPNAHLPFLQDCWRRRIAETWAERGVSLPAGQSPEALVLVPDQALYCAAYGAVIHGLSGTEEATCYRGPDPLRALIAAGRDTRSEEGTEAPLVADAAELERFRRVFAVPAFARAPLHQGQRVRAALGVDGGSTSTKAVLLGEDGTLLDKAYRLSQGNPIQDLQQLLGEIRARFAAQGAWLEIAALGVTGYAGGVLQRVTRADVDVAETIAHMNSALALFGAVDVICDVGGQDIKVLFLRNGELQSFRLSNQCSAGNGMLLQSTADQFGIPVQDFAAHAFAARVVPRFTAGCAVFLDSHRVTLQREGFQPEELMAGLARVLPKNIWQYVVQVPRLSRLGRRFVLQGGTQYNLAAVKAQVDYVRERVPEAEVFVHPHPGEAGAIGAALEAWDVVRRAGHSTFIGLDATIELQYAARTDESTRCAYCTNRCARTFIDTLAPDGSTVRYISGASCERGQAENVEALKAIERGRRERNERLPNLARLEAQRLFAPIHDLEPLPGPESVIHLAAPRGRFGWGEPRIVSRHFKRSEASAAARRAEVRIGMPRCLDLWGSAPFWRAYFESLGVRPAGLIFSRESGERMFAEGAKYGAVDPCYPGKVVQAHIHDLLLHVHRPDRPLHFVFFPTVTQCVGGLPGVTPNACPVVTGTPNVIKAAFTKEGDYFAVRGIDYVDGTVNMADRESLGSQLHAMWGKRLRITRDESDFAAAAGFHALDQLDAEMRARGRELLEQAARKRRYCVLLLARPYHLDPGLNHGVPELVQALGFPVLTLRSLPRDVAWLRPHFADCEAHGTGVLDIQDVWPEAHTANTSVKVWGAKLAARHPFIAVLDLSSFKCGHDAPIYGIVDNILSQADIPYLALHDLDANRPTGTLQIRLRTFAYALRKREAAYAATAAGTGSRSAPNAIDGRPTP